MYQIDLNADLGEGCGDDSAIIPLLSSANISCGAHAGNTADTVAALTCCRDHAVVVGAHPSYPDRANFGRLSMALPHAELLTSLRQQIDHLCQLASTVGVEVRYIKLHGALYNDAAKDPLLAALLADFFAAEYPALALLTLPGGCLFTKAEQAGIAVYGEAFADRAYQANGQLVSRQQHGAILSNQDAIRQSLQLVCQQQVDSIDGQSVTLRAASLCLHGDSPHALALAQQLRQTLVAAQVRIVPFWQEIR
jgi:UPF0271 protein